VQRDLLINCVEYIFGAQMKIREKERERKGKRANMITNLVVLFCLGFFRGETTYMPLVVPLN
jgi:hypothetical protein